ncbi:hypothetical protein BOO71_0011431 [Deinococcus marmoris]|uniref:Uncharacterized protein n=1 Tax=Deinococcus marmoris TaxID=249408 RepID=A0A1U7NUG6_9DEIO|nr:hypothetical protein BOO71_0011431 [Deinococcus marmoris]
MSFLPITKALPSSNLPGALLALFRRRDPMNMPASLAPDRMSAARGGIDGPRRPRLNFIPHWPRPRRWAVTLAVNRAGPLNYGLC